MQRTEAITAAIEKLYLLTCRNSECGHYNCREFREIAESLRAATDWEPIAEKHRDGNWWLVWDAGLFKAFWTGCAWNSSGGRVLNPTHAQPLPTRPKTKEGV